MNKFRPEANFVQGLSGDFIGKNNIFRMIREFARYSNINSGYYMEFGIMNQQLAAMKNQSEELIKLIEREIK